MRRFVRSEGPVLKRLLPGFTATSARVLAVAVLAPLTLATLGACGGHTPVLSEADRCNEQIVLSLAPGFTRTGKLMGDLSDDAHVQLDYLRSASPNLHVFRLSSKEKDPDCRKALGRLQMDRHVRFAELDGRRTAFDSVK